MAASLFKVKALFEYNSGHEDDLAFPENAIIAVTNEDDADWYEGEYTDANGITKNGLFPRNFVERYEPAPPPRPNRASRPPRPPSVPVPAPALAPAPVPVADADADPTPAKEPHPNTVPERAEPEPDPDDEVPVAQTDPVSAIPAAVAIPPSSPEQPSLPKPPRSAPAPPISATGSKSPPPPVAVKPQSFKDRIAAFNRSAAAPIAPSKGNGASNGFIKKPFVAPPPSRNAYIPPPPQRVREGDTENRDRPAPNHEVAEKAGLSSPDVPAALDEDAPKPQSLKERIALLQRQQMEQAARQAESSAKERAKRAHKKHPEPHEQTGKAEKAEASEPGGQVQSKRRSSHHVTSPEVHANGRESFSDGNDADQSAAGETTEDADVSSTTVEEHDGKARGNATSRAPAPPPHQPDVGDEEDATEEDNAEPQEKQSLGAKNDEEESEEEDEMDEETRRRIELRERMAKLSGGMGMAGMFGMPMPAAKPPPPKKTTAAASGSERKSIDSQRLPEQSPSPPPASAAMIAIPGMGIPHTHSPDTGQTEMAVRTGAPQERDVQGSDGHDEPLENDAHPPIAQDRPVPPLPDPRRPVPPPPPADRPRSPSSESEGEPVVDRELPAEEASPSIRQLPPEHSPEGPSSPPALPRLSTSSDRRASRPIPPIPGVSSPAMPSSVAPRPPPPPPPVAPPPAKLHAHEDPYAHLGFNDDMEGETEYEGDYDTDIAPGASHKDALKTYAKDPTYDEPMPASPVNGSPVSPASLRAVPPVPQQQPLSPSLKSMDALRGAPPPPPRESIDSPRINPNLSRRISVDSSRVFSLPPRRESMDAPRTAALPPPSQPRSPLVEDEHAARGYNSLNGRPGRMSLDVGHAFGSRRSMDQYRPSIDHSRIANDVDLGQTSQWWTQKDLPPPVFRDRMDILYEIDESITPKRGGRSIVQKDVYVLFQDYSRTVVTARFDTHDPTNATLEQRHDLPPQTPRQDLLEDAYEKFGRRIRADVFAKKNTVVGDGSPQALVFDLLKKDPSILLPVGTRAYGALIYSNLANASVQQSDEIRPGDVISLRNAKFEGNHGPVHAKYKMEVGKPHHVAVVVQWDGTKRKITALAQGRDSKKVKDEHFRMGDLKSGEVRVWRVMGKDWVGWDIAT